MSTHPFIPLYVDDYDAATAHLTPEEDGIYSRLIRLCWRTPGCSLPNDHAWIARKVRLSADEWERIGAPLVAEFFTPLRGRLIQKRLKREYDEITRKKTARQNAGKSGGLAKAAKTKENAPSNASVLPADTRAFPEPEPEEETPVVPKGTKAPKIILRQAHVEAVWDITPAKARTKTSRADVLKALQGAARRGHQAEDVLAGLVAYFAAPEIAKEDHRYAKGTHRMINDDRWKDFVGQTPVEASAAAPHPLDQHRRRVDHFKNGSGYWNTTDWGPQPGRPGCTVPASILAEFGFTTPSNVVPITSDRSVA